MGNHKDKVKEAWKSQRDGAIHFAQLWINMELEQYVEPSRLGSQRGKPIGLSRRKFHAALSMVLYPACLKLRQIAKRVGVSEGLLRVWRTEPRFKKKVEWACQLFGETIGKEMEATINKFEIDDIRANDGEFIVQGDVLKILKSKKGTLPEMLEAASKQRMEIIEIDDTDTDILACVERFDDPLEEILLLWVRFLPFFNPSVSVPVYELLSKNLDRGVWYAHLMIVFHREFFIDDETTLRKWEARPEVLKVTKVVIENAIDNLMDPETWKRALHSKKHREQVLKTAKGLKRLIFNKLDILSK